MLRRYLLTFIRSCVRVFRFDLIQLFGVLILIPKPRTFSGRRPWRCLPRTARSHVPALFSR